MAKRVSVKEVNYMKDMFGKMIGFTALTAVGGAVIGSIGNFMSDGFGKATQTIIGGSIAMKGLELFKWK